MTETETVNSHRVSIVMKPATNSAGGLRMKVYRADDIAARDPDTLTLGWDHSMDGPDNALAALDTYLAPKGDGWKGRWVVGAMKDCWVAVMAS